MSARSRTADTVVGSATIVAFAMIANQVASKATRDALFLTNFDVSFLPRMVAAAAFVTIGTVLLASRVLPRIGPRRLVPAAFVVSALLLIGIRGLTETAPRAAAVAFYLHISVFGAVLISWFWSMISERFDPRTAKKTIGRIAGGGTLGGLIGGLAVERAATTLALPSVLPFLAALHLVCAAFAVRIGRVRETGGAGPRPDAAGTSGFRVLSRTPYLRNLGLLVLLGTVAAALLDYVFKLRAQEAIADGATLLRFFALFYTGVAALTFVLQTTVTRRLLQRLGLARTASSLPLFVGLGGLTALFVPGLPAIAAVRGSESALRSSLFRSAYELFYTPIAPGDKRATKTILDVGFDRLGDALGAGAVQLVLAAGLIGGGEVLIGAAAVLGFGGLLVARRLHQGYVGALGDSLQRRAEALEGPAEALDPTIVLEPGVQPELNATLPDLDTGMASGITTLPFGLGGGAGDAAETAAAAPAPSDPVIAAAAALRSRDPARVRSTLRSSERLTPELVPHVIRLLAWDTVTGDAEAALRSVCNRHPGQLVDALLDRQEEFTIRRRIPRVLAMSSSRRAVAGLIRGLRDRRFEVRYQCGAALARVHERKPDLAIDRGSVLRAVEREAHVDRRVWESQHLLDEDTGVAGAPFFDEVLRQRSSRSLEHVFTLLSLVFPTQPLRIAYRGLHTEDQTLRGTALEYLESILPLEIRECLWPFLDDARPRKATKPAEAVLDELLKSHESIQLNLDELRRRAGDS